ncbi:MAG: hypothetical protein U1E76_15885 [Planctomycetota bacterium]
MAELVHQRSLAPRSWLLLVAAGALVAVHAWLLAAQPWVAHFDRFLALELAAFALYALAAIGIVRHDGRRTLVAIWLVAVALRAVMLCSETELSDDIARYLFEGRVLAAGVNPLVTPPSDPSLAHLRLPAARAVAHAEIASVYPPLAQLAFWLAARLHLGERGWRAGMIACELITIALLALALRRRKLPLGRLAIYAWHPLPVLEVASSGHIDALALPLLVAVVMLVPMQRAYAAAVALALAVLAKLQSACLAPLLLLLRGRGGAALLVALAIVVAAYLPFAQPGFLDGTRRYGVEWSFNGPVFVAVRALSVHWQEALKTYVEQGKGDWGGIAYGLDERVLARAILLLLLAAAAVVILVVRATVEQRAVSLCAAALLLSPTAHPWYAISLIAALTLAPVLPLLLLTGTLVIAYRVLPAYQATQEWQEDPITLLAEYLVPLAWLGAALTWRWLHRGRNASSMRGGACERQPPGRHHAADADVEEPSDEQAQEE